MGENVLRGAGGNDDLDGEHGNDTLDGGPGSDTLDDDGGSNKFNGGTGDDTLILESNRDPADPTTQELYFHPRLGRDTVRNFQIAHDTIYLCGFEGLDWTGWPSSAGYRISVWAYDELPYVGRVKWFHGSITLEGVSLPWSRNNPPGGLKLIVSNTCAPPVVERAAVTGSSLKLTFNEKLETGNPGASPFTVTVNGSTRTIAAVGISGSTVTLTLSSAVTSGQTVTVSYTRPSTNPLKGDGFEVESFPSRPVTNSTP